MEIKEVTLELAGDNDGSGVALRGWLMSAGPDVPWTVLPGGPSDGQGVADAIGLYLGSAAAALELYDRIRQWITSRGRQAKPVTVTIVLETAEFKDTVIVTLDPQALADGNGRAA